MPLLRNVKQLFVLSNMIVERMMDSTVGGEANAAPRCAPLSRCHQVRLHVQDGRKEMTRVACPTNSSSKQLAEHQALPGYITHVRPGKPCDKHTQRTESVSTADRAGLSGGRQGPYPRRLAPEMCVFLSSKYKCVHDRILI